MTALTYGSNYIYYFESSSGKVGVSEGTGELWATAGTGDAAEIWFELASNTSNSGTSVNAGDGVYLCTNGRGTKRYLNKRAVGDDMRWDLVLSIVWTISSDGVATGQPIPVGATVTFGDGSGYIGLGTSSYLAYTGQALDLVPTFTS
jgi:hypothetical protein